MTNKEFQELLKDYPDDMQIKLQTSTEIANGRSIGKIIDFEDENIMETSDTAYLYDDADPETWTHEDGKFEYGDGQHYLLLNPVII